MSDLAIVLGSGLTVAFIGAIYAYGKLAQKVEHLSKETSKLRSLFENHMKHDAAFMQTELSAIKTEIALLKERVEILGGLVRG